MSTKEFPAFVLTIEVLAKASESMAGYQLRNHLENVGSVVKFCGQVVFYASCEFGVS